MLRARASSCILHAIFMRYSVEQDHKLDMLDLRPFKLPDTADLVMGRALADEWVGVSPKSIIAGQAKVKANIRFKSTLKSALKSKLKLK